MSPRFAFCFVPILVVILAVMGQQRSSPAPSPCISEASPFGEEMMVLMKSRTLLDQIEQDLAYGRITVTAATKMLTPLLKDSILRNSMYCFPGSTDSERLARMLYLWVETRHRSHPTEASESVLRSMKGEMELHYAPSLQNLDPDDEQSEPH
ncbi:MAG: hypothetical protein U0744_18515 [Gemmataceae bacterium]